MKPVLMIHDVYDDIFSLPLADYTLTLDDGLYSQYAYLQRFAQIPTDKVFFISTKFICNGHQSTECPRSWIAHDRARVGDFSDFMTKQQIIQIMNTPGCTIGGHGHEHVFLNGIRRIVDRIQAIKLDTEAMLCAFRSEFDTTPSKFCFPYNNNLDGLYDGLLRQYGFTEFYGHERISAEELLRK